VRNDIDWNTFPNVLAQLALIVCLVVSPWVYGGVQPGVQAMLLGCILVAGCLCCGSIVFSKLRLQSSWKLSPFVPFLLILAIGLLQLLPTWWQTEYPAATRLEIARLVMASGIFAISAFVFRSPGMRPALWILLACNGAVLGFFGIAHSLRPDSGLFGYVPTHGGSPFASFVSKNSAAGYLNLCVAAGLGMLAWARTRAQDVTRKQPLTGRFQSRVDGLQLLALFCIVVSLAGIFCSMSRGGCIAAVGAGLVTVVCLPGRNRWKVAAVGTAVVGLCVALVWWTGLSANVESRLATLSSGEITKNGRLHHWQDAFRTASHAWFAGSGLGTYRYAYLPFQANSWDVWFHHAENQYIETLVECGILGLAALSLILITVGSHLRMLYKRPNNSTSADLRVAGLFALCSMSLQSLFDFPLVIPSNMLVFAAICGAVIGAAASGMGTKWKWQLSLPQRVRLIPAWVTVLFFAYGVFGLQEMMLASSIEIARTDITKTISNQPEPAESEQRLSKIDRHIATLDELAARRPDDAELHRQIADLWTLRYRVQAFEQLCAADSDAGTSKQRLAEIWRLTQPVVLYLNANQARKSGRPEILAALQNNPVVLENLVPAVRHLQLALQSCAILPRVNLDLATLAFLQDEKPNEADHLRRELYLSSANSEILYSIGLCAASASLEDIEHQAWRRSLALNPRHLLDVVDFLTKNGAGIDEIIKALPDSPRMLSELASKRFSEIEFASERIALQQQARRLLDARQDRDTGWYREYAEVNAAAGKPDLAVTAYRSAISLQPRDVEMRLELSRLLQQCGRLKEASEEARICALLDPDRDDVKALIRELTRSGIREPDCG